jgi:hypothetical protein
LNLVTTLETRKFVTISTGHVSAATVKLLDSTPCAKWPCVGGGYADYGWFFYAHDENAGVADQRIPGDLFAVMTWARQKRFSHILLDRDAERVDDLPWHDW